MYIKVSKMASSIFWMKFCTCFLSPWCMFQNSHPFWFNCSESTKAPHVYNNFLHLPITSFYNILNTKFSNILNICSSSLTVREQTTGLTAECVQWLDNKNEVHHVPCIWKYIISINVELQMSMFTEIIHALCRHREYHTTPHYIVVKSSNEKRHHLHTTDT